MSLKFKRHYKLIVLLVLFSAVMALGLCDQRIIAYTLQEHEQVAEQGSSEPEISAGLDLPSGWLHQVAGFVYTVSTE